MRPKAMVLLLVFGLTIQAISLGAYAAEEVVPGRLPEPLSLQDVLSFFDADHPSLVSARTRVDLAVNRLERARSSYGWTAYADLQPRLASKAARPGHDFDDDSRYGIVVRKRLTDFGRSDSRQTSAVAALDSERQEYALERHLHQVELMRRFFAVILADRHFQVADEKLAMDFIRFKRARDRYQRFAEHTEVKVKELETIYTETLTTRTRRDLVRKQTRHALALAMGRPGELSRQLLMPDLSAYDSRVLPSYEELLEAGLDSAPSIKAARQRIEAARAAVRAAQRLTTPVLTAELEARTYAQELSSGRDDYRATLKFKVPIIDGRRLNQGEVSDAQVRLERAEAELTSREYALRLNLLELLHGLEINKLEHNAATVREDYRSIYQDKSRTLYELEMKSDLGDAQAKVAEAIWMSIKVGFEKVVLWAELDAILGRPLLLAERREGQ